VRSCWFLPNAFDLGCFGAGLAESLDQRVRISDGPSFVPFTAQQAPKRILSDFMLLAMAIAAQTDGAPIVGLLAHARPASQAQVRDLDCGSSVASAAGVRAYKVAMSAGTPAAFALGSFGKAGRKRHWLASFIALLRSNAATFKSTRSAGSIF
jgi:hypothetical protein